MLHIAPETVDMSRAVDDGSEGEGRLSRQQSQGTYSPSGVFGQATLATAAKGKYVADQQQVFLITDHFSKYLSQVKGCLFRFICP